MLFLIFVAGMLAGAGAWLLVERVVHSPQAAGSRETTSQEKAEPTAADVVNLELTAQRNIALTLERAQTRAVQQMIQVTGSVGPNESRLAHIRPLARGRIERVYVRLGDRVVAGQPLVDYDNIELGDLIGQYRGALAALEKASADAEVAKRALDRARNLVELGAVARAEYDRRDAEHKTTLASISSQRAEIARIEEKFHRFGLTDSQIQKLNLGVNAKSEPSASDTTLRARFAGIVTKYNAVEGEVVEPTDELFNITDLSAVWVQADVYEKDIASIRVGQEARIVTDSYPGQIFIGKITYVSDFLDPKTRTARVRCEVANRDGRLKLDMFATIQLPMPSTRQTLMIPSGAVQRIEDRPIAFVKIGETQFQRRDVKLGAASDEWVEVSEGIKAGELVVTRGSFFMKSKLLRERIGGEE